MDVGNLGIPNKATVQEIFVGPTHSAGFKHTFHKHLVDLAMPKHCMVICVVPAFISDNYKVSITEVKSLESEPIHRARNNMPNSKTESACVCDPRLLTKLLF